MSSGVRESGSPGVLESVTEQVIELHTQLKMRTKNLNNPKNEAGMKNEGNRQNKGEPKNQETLKMKSLNFNPKTQ